MCCASKEIVGTIATRHKEGKAATGLTELAFKAFGESNVAWFVAPVTYGTAQKKSHLENVRIVE